MLYYMGFQKPGFYGKEQTKKIFKFVEKKVIWFTISIVVIVVGIGSIIFNVAKGNDAFNYSIEFKSGGQVDWTEGSSRSSLVIFPYSFSCS